MPGVEPLEAHNPMAIKGIRVGPVPEEGGFGLDAHGLRWL